MTGYRYQALGPLLAGEGSRAFLGLAISEDNRAVPVVIIWVPEAAERDAAVLAKVKQETEHASKLDHPNIVTVLGFAELDEGHARVVEFADGESLRKVLEAGKQLPPSIAARVICDACTGAHYAHVAGNDDGSALVHGDLRPETLLVGYNGTTKVTGYGALAFAPREVGGQRVQGRQVHSAPEQIIGGRAALVLATDVYLLGLSLYECLTGVVPWAEQGDFFEHAVLTLPLPPPPPDSVPPALEAIVQTACSKKAADRYPTPLALREAIEAALPGGIASTEEVARYLETVFPESHQLRADRRHTIDAGIADFVRRQWASPSAPVPPTPAPASATPSPPRPPPPPPSTTPRAPAVPAPVSRGRPASSPSGLRPPPPPPPLEDDDEPQRESGRSAPWLVVLAVFVGIIAAWWAWKKAHEPIPGIDPLPRATATDPVRGSPASSPTPPVDAGAELPTRTAATPPVAEVADAGSTQVSTVVDAGRAGEAMPAEVLVSIQSTPNVELLLEGKPMGRTPWSGRLPPGRKTITFQNKNLGLSVVRWVTVGAEPVTEKFTFEKGGVSVNAPEGAVIFIDTLRIGVAPISGEIPVYEGSHRISVTVGKSKWSDTFRLRPGQRVNFNVELQ
jgi:serine/threonine-protein kinase